MNSGNNRLYIYAKPTERQWADGEYPPVRVDLLTRWDLHGAATLATIAFSLTDLPRFCWDGSRGWLELPYTLMPTMFPDAQDFINAIPRIQAWLYGWSESAARAPDLSPDWATARKVARATVEEFSKGLERQLARPASRSIGFCDANGTEVRLFVPARAALSLPPIITDDASILQVARKERTLKLALATGREVMMPIGALSSTIDIDSAPLLVDPRRLRTKPVTHVKRVWSLPEELPGEDLA